MSDEPARSHPHDTHPAACERPFWARARIDHRGLNTVAELAYAVAQRWVPEQAARQFSSAANAAAALMVERGGATLNMWEEPGELVCQIVRAGIEPGGPRRSAGTRTGPTEERDRSSTSGIEVRRSPDEATVRMAVQSVT